jgi:hypothetical protein
VRVKMHARLAASMLYKYYCRRDYYPIGLEIRGSVAVGFQDSYFPIEVGKYVINFIPLEVQELERFRH